MTVKGHVRNGRIELDEPTPLSEGMQVQVIFLEDGLPSSQAKPRTLLERLQPLVGAAMDLPADLAENHDHYLHGQPKK